MFSNLFFLILALLVINIGMDNPPELWFGSPIKAFIASLFLYLPIIVFIKMQGLGFKHDKRDTKKAAFLPFVHLQLLTYLAITQFFLGSQRIFSFSQTIDALWWLLLYFGGLWVFYSYSENRKLEIRFLVPFVLPFLLFTFLADLLKFVPPSLFDTGNEFANTTIAFSASILFMILIMMLLPGLIQKIWLCKDLDHPELKERLEAICKKAHFSHAGIKTWTVMDNAFTAAIIGIIPRYRYIMFTKQLLRRLKPTSIEAILAHEIGHSYRKHLWFYPLIIFGMILLSGLFSLIFSEAISQYFSLRNFLNPSPFWQGMDVLGNFLPYILILGLYFRFVFGYFSRLFERQADLHVFVLGMSPQHMMEALNEVGIATGNTHLIPSWHHFGIQERINFLKETEQDPSLPAKHDRRVHLSLWIYMFCLALASALIISPLLPKLTPFKQINQGIEKLSHTISSGINHSLRGKVSKKLSTEYHLPGDQDQVNAAFEKGLAMPLATEFPGAMEFYTAQQLLKDKNIKGAAILMTHAWKNLEIQKVDISTIKAFTRVTEKILAKSPDSELNNAYLESLEVYSINRGMRK